MIKVSTDFSKPYVLKNYVKRIDSLKNVKYAPKSLGNDASKNIEKKFAFSKYYSEDRYFLLHGFPTSYKIDFIWSNKKHGGTNIVKKIVRESMLNKETNGRVLVEAYSVDHETNPAGFFYKLGFRFKDKDNNAKFKLWEESGGEKSNVPPTGGLMFLPRENILKCLKYGE